MPEVTLAHEGPDAASGPWRTADGQHGLMTRANEPSPGSNCHSGTILAFDFGLKRIGVAVGEEFQKFAHSLATIRAETNIARFEAIARLIHEWQPSRLVVGLPFGLDGSEHEMTKRCRRFANQLHGRFGLPVVLTDERLTSAEAETILRESCGSKGYRKEDIDAVAARLILQDYLNAAP